MDGSSNPEKCCIAWGSSLPCKSQLSGCRSGYPGSSVITPTHEPTTAVNRTLVPVLGWSIAAMIGGAMLYWAFAVFTGLETSLAGIPVGLAVGQAMRFASGKRGGRRFQILAV